MTSCLHFRAHDNTTTGHRCCERPIELTAADDNTTSQEMGDVMSQAFNRLTFEERQEQQDLLHGVDGEVLEDAALVTNSLRDLDVHLLRVKSGSEYEQAEKVDPAYVSSRALRLMFLRGNRYDAEAAAGQMIRFFKMKKKIFGTENLVRNITIEDLDEDDRACLRSGCMQVTCKDTSNRPIFFQIPGLIPRLSTQRRIQGVLRARFFITMKLLETEEAQRRGAIKLSYLVGHCKDSNSGEGFLDFHKLSMALPLYTAAYHVCTDDWTQAALGNVVMHIMPAKDLARSRVHFGTHLECQYLLSTFGIPASLLPLVPETNIVDLAPHLKWYQKCVANDGTDWLITRTPSMVPITEPNQNDVLLAGSKKLETVGNRHLRELINTFAEAYMFGSNEEKRRIVDRIVDEIHEAGGRFLQRDKVSLTWTELSLSKVRLKMTQRFRNHIRRHEPASKRARMGTQIADMPLAQDVIFGRAQRSEGNTLLHHLIKGRSEEYEALDWGMKNVVLDAIMEQIKGRGGRFLQPAQDFEGYVELPAEVVRDKIAIYFRNHRRLSKRRAFNETS